MIINVNAKPSSYMEKIERAGENSYNIELKEKAEGWKANERILMILSKELKIDYKNLKIINPKSRHKLIKVRRKV